MFKKIKMKLTFFLKVDEEIRFSKFDDVYA